MEPILTREQIAHMADESARVTTRTRELQPNPFPAGSDAAAAWKASYERLLLAHTNPECESSA